ncbi:MAG: dCMP deaminase family protein [Candidatus Nealsonbacteria bacterium]|nr:dCMP deaminase family protein [Candidatus Nealsonbacteria bacterium]
MERPCKEKYYLNIAREVAQRSTCLRVKIGAVIVRDDQIIATGYAGAPRKTLDCYERGFCLRNQLNIPHGQRYELCRSCHAEQNAIINSARAGVSLLGGDMYQYAQDKEGKVIDGLPCFICKKMIINAGLNRMICSNKEGDYKIFNIKDWVKDWQENDIVDDKNQYGIDQN